MQSRFFTKTISCANSRQEKFSSLVQDPQQDSIFAACVRNPNPGYSENLSHVRSDLRLHFAQKKIASVNLQQPEQVANGLTMSQYGRLRENRSEEAEVTLRSSPKIVSKMMSRAILGLKFCRVDYHESIDAMIRISNMLLQSWGNVIHFALSCSGAEDITIQVNQMKMSLSGLSI
jgi:hypothetical protein